VRSPVCEDGDVPAEPEWLLSTTAQSSAALVGIIGGLLVSRLVAMAAERSAIERQLNEDLVLLRDVTSEIELARGGGEPRGSRRMPLERLEELVQQQGRLELSVRLAGCGWQGLASSGP
jgi:hypothetical protein